MVGDDKAETALAIIAGIQPPWAYWKLFFPDKDQPRYDPRDCEAFAIHRDAMNLRVRRECCIYVAQCLNTEWHNSMEALAGHDDTAKPLTIPCQGDDG